MRGRVTARNRSEPMEDEDLQQIITERIEEDPVFWTGSGRRRTFITVEVEDGHVMLSGVVRSPLDRRRADILARALGATSVDNRLGVADDSSSGKDKSKRSVA
jgi:osmotically-inducible protein OsmY